MRQSCGTDIGMSLKKTKFSAQKNCKVNISTDQQLKKMRINEPTQTTGIQQGFVYVQGP